MLVSDIKSRPVYQGLRFDPKARRHLVAADDEGAIAVEALAGEGGDTFARNATVLYTGRDDGRARIEALKTDAVYVTPTVPTLLTRLDVILAAAGMTDRLYVAGDEGFIGQVVALGMRHGIDHVSIRTEHRGSLQRRVQCVHCKGITEGVTTSIATCAHCGLHLIVRDHYSRRLAAFMGVCADAEEPGVLPPVEEIFK
ncbi:MAG: hypothetical protein KDG89_02700 [Geminicoccaceae bacterium]|nr:hypothetical protein [Geminicoccaceae bacterium]